MRKYEDPFEGCEMLSVERAKRLKHDDTLYHIRWTNSDGSPARWRVNGKPKVWRTRPNDVTVPIKRGLYQYGYVYHYFGGSSNIQDFAVIKEKE